MSLHTLFVISMILTGIAMSALITISPLDRIRVIRQPVVGTRLRWLKRKKSGKFESITAVVTAIVGPSALVEEVYGDRRIWVRRDAIVMKGRS